jgi:prevent-host-death family protein
MWMEINIKEARSKLGLLLDKAEKGEEIIVSRRGRRVARLVPIRAKKNLPSLKGFRASISIDGEPVSVTIARNREEERY